MERNSKTISAYTMSILKSSGIFSAGGILLYPVAILLQALTLLRKQIGGILGMLDSKDYAHLFPVYLEKLMISHISNILNYVYVIICPALIYRIHKRFITNNIEPGQIANPSHYILMILAVLSLYTSNFLYFGPLVIKDEGPIEACFYLGFILSIVPILTSLLVIGIPCGYLDTKADVIDDGMNEEEQVKDVIEKYLQYHEIVSPYLFFVYTGYTLQLIFNMHTLTMNFGSCSALSKVTQIIMISQIVAPTLILIFTGILLVKHLIFQDCASFYFL